MSKIPGVRLAIVGHRDFTDRALFREAIGEWVSEHGAPSWIISGGAKGADALAERYARGKQIPITIFHAAWRIFGRAAGPIRNKQIVGAADHILAFLHPDSKGTKNTIEQAHKEGKQVTIVELSSTEKEQRCIHY